MMKKRNTARSRLPPAAAPHCTCPPLADASTYCTAKPLDFSSIFCKKTVLFRLRFNYKCITQQRQTSVCQFRKNAAAAAMPCLHRFSLPAQAKRLPPQASAATLQPRRQPNVQTGVCNGFTAAASRPGRPPRRRRRRQPPSADPSRARQTRRRRPARTAPPTASAHPRRLCNRWRRARPAPSWR